MISMFKLTAVLFALLFVQATFVASAPLDGAGANEARFALASRASDDTSGHDVWVSMPDSSATSRPNRALYPGTEVPSDVMTHLMSERHGVENHVPMGVVQNHWNNVIGKFHEMILDPNTPVSSMKHDGETYFLTRFRPMRGSPYPEWSQMVVPTAHVEREALYPIFIGKIGSRTAHGQNIQLLAIRSPATVLHNRAVVCAKENKLNKLGAVRQLFVASTANDGNVVPSSSKDGGSVITAQDESGLPSEEVVSSPGVQQLFRSIRQQVRSMAGLLHE
ncbi:hypothetical protein L1887_59836 [Cichorium endivia]|nr:hypothetical protein L1887_59836 [Cichorium endivia]